MLDSLELKNFKCFQQQKIAFRPLTLLTGVNSAGKSTTIQALLLLQQTFTEHRKAPEAQLSGELVNLGLPEDVLNSNAEDDAFSLEAAQDGTSFLLRATVDGKKLRTEPMTAPACAFANFRYLNAERLCPRTVFPVPTETQRSCNAIGNQGEFAAYHLHVSGQMKIAYADAGKPNLLAPDAAGDSATLQMQTEAWLSLLGAPVRLQTDRPTGTDSIVLRFSFPDISNTYYRPTNVGFGLTYALPVFVAALGAPAGSLLIVENPEAHLHPKGQALMGRFLARAAACGIQIIMETHSDHVLNGVRVAVKQGDIAHDAVQINFFHQRDGISRLSAPRIDRDGHIDQWPDDFFDEWDKQLSELL